MDTVSCALLHLTSRYYTLTKELKRTLQGSRQARLTEEIHSLSDKTAAGEILHRLRPFIGPSNPKKNKKKGLPAVKKPDGSICQTPQESRDCWIQYFGKMEGGERMSHEKYRECWRQTLEQFRSIDPFSLSITEVPSLVDLENAYRRVAVGKAVGEDGMPPELCRYKAADLARLSYSIMLKVLLFGQEAAEHKGGRLAIAWKNKGDVRDCATHRSLLVSSHIGKTLHRALRQKNNGLYIRFMQAQQLGGRPKMPVGVPLLAYI